VADRTAELEEAMRELEAYSYTVAHDLGAPLRAMRTFAAMIANSDRKALSAKGRKGLQLLQDGIDQIGRLTEDLLTFSKMGRRKPERKAVEMVPLVRQVLAELRKEFPEMAFRTTVCAMPDALGDEGLLRQVYANILSNALKFACPCRPLRIRAGVEQRPGGAVYYVKDNGVGFNPDHGQLVFELFRRLPNAEACEGTGAGLAIVKRIIEQHGGKVWAEGQPGKGAAFYFTLPKPEDAEIAKIADC
jgi:light-regulated signal transduction histidine kinase (bacteriophytochrome)